MEEITNAALPKSVEAKEVSAHCCYRLGDIQRLDR